MCPKLPNKQERNDEKADDVYEYLKNERDREIFQDIIRYEFSLLPQEKRKRIFDSMLSG